MGALTPLPHQVRSQFRRLYAQAPKRPRTGTIGLAVRPIIFAGIGWPGIWKWNCPCEDGVLEITINLSKPEKDPRAIAAAKDIPQFDYPQCQLCMENEGYPGRVNYPVRQNHRPIPIELAGSNWYLQYSPYVYYHEHCIVFHEKHTPMKMDGQVFQELLEFVTRFPHYFIGSNAELPIVGGSILGHEHFQGGRHGFAMEKASIETWVQFVGFEDVCTGIVKWPMPVIRLQGTQADRLAALADRILTCWRHYTDANAMIFAKTDGILHNMITPIACRKGAAYELDLVLRNNMTTAEHPLGLFHPHEKLHHIKKENIGLIEVMGLAVLPSRLKWELQELKTAILERRDLQRDQALSKHADWVEELEKRYHFTPDNTAQILQNEVGAVFAMVLEDAGVFQRTAAGKAAFLRFLD